MIKVDKHATDGCSRYSVKSDPAVKNRLNIKWKEE